VKPTIYIGATVRTLLCLLCLLLYGNLWAQEAKVRTSFKTDTNIWVGQKVTLVVEVLAPGYFSTAVTFDLPEPHGVLIMPPIVHPILSSETIDDTRYTVQRHELSAYPMRAGEQSVPAFSVHFEYTSSPLDTNGIAATVKTNPMPIKIEVPPGAEDLGQVISARDLKIDETWQPEPGKESVKAGSAFTRTMVFTAPDVPGMLFPPVPTNPIDGLGIYPKRQLLDHTDNGSLTGERRDVVTYVCQKPGEFTIPAVRFIWFDLDTQQLQTKDFPERTLKVIANPALATSSGAQAAQPVPPMPSSTWWKLAGVAVVAFLLFIAVWSTRFRRAVADFFTPFRPLHLQPLNPTEQSQK
jgi:hypothetical protein